jgi:hypothetical protein
MNPARRGLLHLATAAGLGPLRRWALGLGTLSVAAGGLAGCASPPMGLALRRTRPAGLPERLRLRAVPFFPDDDDLCGPAVLASLLSAAGRPVDKATLREQVYLPGRGGTLQAEMLAGARRHGTLAVLLPPQLDEVLRQLQAGWPVGLLVNRALPAAPRWHYLVLTGYDLAAGVVWVHSGPRADEPWPMAPFERTWARSGHWAFVVLPPGELPVEVATPALVDALLGLDRAAPPAAPAAWGAAARRWPDEPTYALGLGNAWVAVGETTRAEAVLRATAERFDSAVAWNNLAQLAHRRGDAAAAQAAAERAVARARSTEPAWIEAAERTLATVGGAPR